MPVDRQENARKAVRAAQVRYERAKSNLDKAGEQRRMSFEVAKEDGLSLADIGQAVGLHRSRVDQILKGK